MKPAFSFFEKTMQEMRDLFAGKEVHLDTGKIHLLNPCKGKIPSILRLAGQRS